MIGLEEGLRGDLGSPEIRWSHFIKACSLQSLTLLKQVLLLLQVLFGDGSEHIAESLHLHLVLQLLQIDHVLWLGEERIWGERVGPCLSGRCRSPSCRLTWLDVRSVFSFQDVLHLAQFL